ncbi:NAD(P)-dependent oxidoreductase [Candidatus Micrarchaeota archaeon]|nr:MAG: NAD(P)-dependent oxidoreductase [Candidatus Micrarchaeota archaeon]
MAKKVLITGSSGFFGTAMLHYLLNKKYKVLGIDLKEASEKARGFVFKKADIRDASLVDKLTKGVDIVIHAAAAMPHFKKEEIFSVNVLGTKNLLESSIKNKVKRFIFLSSTEIYGFPENFPITESFPLKAFDAYTRSKVIGESLCRGYMGRGTLISILRPTTFVGPGRLRSYKKLYDLARTGRSIPIIGKGNKPYQILHVSDLVSAVFSLIKSNRSRFEDTYNLSPRDAPTSREIMQALLDHAGFGKKVISVAPLIGLPVMNIIERTGLYDIHKWSYMSLYKGHYVSSEKIGKALAWKASKDSIEALLDGYDWYIKRFT